MKAQAASDGPATEGSATFAYMLEGLAPASEPACRAAAACQAHPCSQLCKMPLLEGKMPTFVSSRHISARSKGTTPLGLLAAESLVHCSGMPIAPALAARYGASASFPFAWRQLPAVQEPARKLC